MKPAQLVSQLCDVAEKVGLQVRREDLDGAPGGLCVVKGRRMVLLDAALPPADQAEVLAAAILEAARSGRAADLDGVFIVPEVRQFLDEAGARL